MKGFFFGGETSRIDEIVDLQTSIITKSLNENLLGTEESYFTIMESQCPDLFEKVIITDCSNVMRFL
jgi:hypothetical protein